MSSPSFARLLIAWYQQHQRPLPWRHTRDPYRIWLSEIILQQTRVAQGLPYYHAFVEAFPDVQALAAAEERVVLRLWQGLGYYSRARNLHKCARHVVNAWHGRFPTTYAQLLTLPGVGPYTAAAIASFAFGEAVPVVDGNVFRVLARVFGMHTDIASSEAKKLFFEQAQRVMDRARPADFNQAMMELGAICCTPSSPTCHACPVAPLCFARQREAQQLLPVKSKKTKVRKRYVHYFAIRQANKTLMRERTGKDIWRGLYDFYCVETNRPARLDTLLAADPFLSRLRITQASKPVKHVLSHQQLKAVFYEAVFKKANTTLPEGMKWYGPRQVNALPKPVLIDAYVKGRHPISDTTG
ncbi:MAG: A/G-specific adenine glycosylase [Cyclobacteriaceae bacterium]|jgi:A/G-specific adenine glycosylase|nr:A/G-specific adenine glycosylase [Cyclobacteriaceae bacterium]